MFLPKWNFSYWFSFLHTSGHWVQIPHMLDTVKMSTLNKIYHIAVKFQPHLRTLLVSDFTILSSMWNAIFRLNVTERWPHKHCLLKDSVIWREEPLCQSNVNHSQNISQSSPDSCTHPLIVWKQAPFQEKLQIN